MSTPIVRSPSFMISSFRAFVIPLFLAGAGGLLSACVMAPKWQVQKAVTPELVAQTLASGDVGEARLGEAQFVRRQHAQVDLDVGEAPLAVDAAVLVEVAACHPQGLIPLREYDRLPQQPLARSTIPIDLDDRIGARWRTS